MISHGYNICFLDILGFSDKIKIEGGLEIIKEKYIKLTDAITSINEKYKEVISKGIFEGSYWSHSDIAVFYKINVIYGSDTIIIWADRTWENAKKISDPEKVHPASKWEVFPKVCDPFLAICNEIICKSIELDLPLRGALSTGEGYFDFDKYIFIGKPIVEASELEKLQNIIGASFCLSFEDQIIPERFSLQFDNYLKTTYKGFAINPNDYTNQNLLDWPRHWRNTRSEDILAAMSKLDFGTRNDIKKNTIKFIRKSYDNRNNLISSEETKIANVYKDIYNLCGLPLRLEWKHDHWDIGDFDELSSYVRR